MVFQLLYASAAADGLTSTDIEDIVSASVRNNGPLGLTGMLLLVDGSFFQLLEGDAEAVNQTYQRISKDWRHRSVIHLLAKDAEQRACPCWSMGYRRLERVPKNEAVFEVSNEMVRGGISGISDTATDALMRRFLRISAGERAFA